LINRENPFLNKSVDFIDIKNPEEIEEIDSWTVDVGLKKNVYKGLALDGILN
jgi:hypothetical protein